MEKHYDNNWRVVPLYTGDEELAALPSSGSYAGSPSVTIQQPSRDVLNPMASPPASSAFNNQSGSSQDGSDVYV
ncbi:hypothetical protein EON64_04195 [archaeon]|nr:MAG: hypothetical protein EON64_04195 [archaeon]